MRAKPTARALALRAKPLRVLSLCAAIAFATSGCEAPDARLKECKYIDRPALSMSGTSFRYIEANIYIDGPNQCRKVTDTEGWERTFCGRGPDAAVCRKVAR